MTLIELLLELEEEFDEEEDNELLELEEDEELLKLEEELDFILEPNEGSVGGSPFRSPFNQIINDASNAESPDNIPSTPRSFISAARSTIAKIIKGIKNHRQPFFELEDELLLELEDEDDEDELLCFFEDELLLAFDEELSDFSDDFDDIDELLILELDLDEDDEDAGGAPRCLHNTLP